MFTRYESMCQQMTDDHASSVHDAGGKLATERLSPTCRHDAEGILLGQDCLNDLILVRQEGVETKNGLQNAGSFYFHFITRICHDLNHRVVGGRSGQ